ncbi:LamG domain-containing protein [Flavicella sediminum]|uniref:glycosyl hydrolase n=1 Tax=Flavicella sediminum TaxID=2585141 RepID=UPI001FB7685D|nr:glycosyl hydrolase [Flavicella sediminum]
MVKKNFKELLLIGCVLFALACTKSTAQDVNEEQETEKEKEEVEEEEEKEVTGPYFVGAADPSPSEKKWVKVENLSDEFNDGIFNEEKWHKVPDSNGWTWIGRAPGLFQPENVTVKDGFLNVTTQKFSSPKTVKGNTFTHGGGIVRSIASGNHGLYYECRMKANKTIMSSTFWLAMKQGCPRKLELDIQECVGRVHSGTHSWATKWDHIFHSNAIRHKRSCDTDEETRGSGSVKMTEKNSDRFFVYACWWKSPTELQFFLDGNYVYSVTPTTDFDVEGFITMAIETYDWNPVDEEGSVFETGSHDDLTTKYDWVRTWSLEDK